MLNKKQEIQKEIDKQKKTINEKMKLINNKFDEIWKPVKIIRRKK